MKHYDRVTSEMNKLLDAQVIFSSHSSWSAPIIVVAKGDGGKCLVINYRALIKVTQKFIWPTPVLSTSQPSISMLGIITYPLMKTLFQRQLLHLLFENMNI